MKKIYVFFFACLFFNLTQAQLLLTDNFNFSGKLSDNGWSVHSSGTESIVTTSGGLTYTGYQGSGIGNAANLTGLGEDVNRGFALQSTNGTTIIMSAMVRVQNNLTAKAAYFLHLGKRESDTTFTNFCAKIYAQTDAEGHVTFGLSNNQRDSGGTYAPTVYLPGVTYLVILKYVINTSGPDDVKLWIKSSGVPTSEAEAGTPDVEITNQDKPGNDSVNAVALRQSPVGANVIVDGLYIGNDWNSVVLPVILTSFKATPYNNGALITWTCASETNAQSFELLKSNNAIDFTTITSIPAKNANNTSYSFEDQHLTAGNNYYKLKITNQDGSVSYSNIQVLQGFAGKLQLYPNPVTAKATLLHAAATQGAIISIYNAAGNQISTIPVQTGATQTSLALQHLAAGNYVLVFKNGSQQTVYQFIKQ